MKDDLRHLPSVDVMLQAAEERSYISLFGRSLTADAIREVLSQSRQKIITDIHYSLPDTAALVAEVGHVLDDWLKPSLVPVINASGVILHTNLGRAPLSRAAMEAIHAVSAGYSTLEYDLAKGTRGSRSDHAEDWLVRLTHAEAALVVNNNAAALLLCLSTLARRKRVVISRSQLVEIGGGFRIPEVMSQSGSKLVEIGTTNRVNLADYEAALAEPAALVVRVHHSNYKITGFTEEVSLEDMVGVAHGQGVAVLDDLGSGVLIDTAHYGLAHEPTVQESLQAGADLVCFSGDKLLGGPQAGIIIGKKDLINKIRKHPLARAVRADKLCLAALSATLGHYLRGEAEKEIPIWRMMALQDAELLQRASRWREALQAGEVIAGQSTVGGGSLPEESMPTRLLALKVNQPAKFIQRLRGLHPPVIARVENDLVLLDPRTVLVDQDEALLHGISQVLGTI